MRPRDFVYITKTALEGKTYFKFQNMPHPLSGIGVVVPEELKGPEEIMEPPEDIIEDLVNTYKDTTTDTQNRNLLALYSWFQIADNVLTQSFLRGKWYCENKKERVDVANLEYERELKTQGWLEGNNREALKRLSLL